jgi:hypothetical protein
MELLCKDGIACFLDRLNIENVLLKEAVKAVYMLEHPGSFGS